jgi:hypothetical protein
MKRMQHAGVPRAVLPLYIGAARAARLGAAHAARVQHACDTGSSTLGVEPGTIEVETRPNNADLQSPNVTSTLQMNLKPGLSVAPTRCQRALKDQIKWSKSLHHGLSDGAVCR